MKDQEIIKQIKTKEPERKNDTERNEPKNFNPTKLKKHKRSFYILLILSILSILDIATQQIVDIGFGISDTGLISFFIGAIFIFISPALSGAISVFLSTVFSFAILWIPITIYEYYHIKKLKKVQADH